MENLTDAPGLDEQAVTFPPRGTLLMYTDGAADAMTSQGARFGLERLQESMRASIRAPAQTVCDQVLEALALYQGECPQTDDVTLVAIQAEDA